MAPSANKDGLFDPQTLDTKSHFLIAYSGGSDSTALLHFCAHHLELKQRIRAIHINHQLQSESHDWQEHCEKQCQYWGVECVVERIILTDYSENSARNARRTVFKKHLRNNETLLTAHHQQDQVETVLFRLFRGTGLKGLGGIKKQSLLSLNKFIKRPLLGVSKQKITDYLAQHQVDWVTDPSNQSNKYSRNHIRNRIVPEISTYATHANNSIDSTAKRLQKSYELLMALMPDDNPLALNTNIDATFLHHWLQKKGLSTPKELQLSNFLTSVQQAASHKHPSLAWDTQRLMAWQNHIYLLKAATEVESTQLKWQKHMSLLCGGSLSFSQDMPWGELRICYGVQGERLKMTPHKQHKSIKKLHQEYKTPPWDKSITPFIYHQDVLLAVGHWCSEDFDNLLSANNCRYSWQKAEQIL